MSLKPRLDNIFRAKLEGIKLSKDYRQSHDYELEDEYRMNPNDEDVYRELNNRGYEEVDGELLDEYEYADYIEERERRNGKGER